MKFQKASELKEKKFSDARKINPSAFDRIFAGSNVSVDGSKCWNFTSRTNKDGYGYLKINGKHAKCHRAIYLMFYPNENPKVVRHLCNNPSCVNPAHLRGGTQKDNAADRVNSNRGGNLKGSCNGRAKISDADVFFIRNSSLSGKELSEMFGISNVQANKIKTHKAWRHI